MSNTKLLVIYLPQYHSITENDRAWGNGFTEWTNVIKAKRQFEGHYQPHVPHESVGYYDLRNPGILTRQAEMARKFGIYGFAYYHYWFNGKRLLNTPLDKMLETGLPDFPFCYIWANENWTKRWDGLDDEIIIQQNYSHEDDIEHIRFLCGKVFPNKNYIKVEGRPLFIIYRTGLFPDIKKTVEIWREEAKKMGFPGLYLVKTESFGNHIDPAEIGFDAGMEFTPLGYSIEETVNIDGTELLCYDYSTTVFNSLLRVPDYKFFRCVYPSWDNTARRGNKATVIVNTNPEVFRYSLQKACEFSIARLDEKERFIFINSWNEWGEGCHLEPDIRNGFKYLEICREVLDNPVKYNNPYSDLLKLKASYNRLRNSWSFRIGNAITLPYRKFRNLFK